jgi:trimeric autotransporter adhesin
MIPFGMVSPPAAAAPTPLSVVNAASLSTGPVAPGEVVTIFGSAMGPQTGVAALIDPGSLLANQVAGAEVRFDGVPAPLFYAQANQINAQVPYTVAGNATTNIEVLYQGVSVNTTTATVASSAPGVFSIAINQDGTYNSANNPASSGAYLTIYATGEGLTDGPNISGEPAAAPYPQPNLPVTATLGGVPAQIVWAGSAPGLVGLLQVNLLIPGPYLPSGAAPLQLTVGTVSSPLMTVFVQ